MEANSEPRDLITYDLYNITHIFSLEKLIYKDMGWEIKQKMRKILTFPSKFGFLSNLPCCISFKKPNYQFKDHYIQISEANNNFVRKQLQHQ